MDYSEGFSGVFRSLYLLRGEVHYRARIEKLLNAISTSAYGAVFVKGAYWIYSNCRTGCLYNQGFKSVVPNESTDYMFLYYLLKYSKDKIENLGSGTTFKEISGSTMRGIEVFVPEAVEEQRRIASILSMLDDKIEKNIAVNENLAA